MSKTDQARPVYGPSGTVLRLSRRSPVPLSWRLKTVIYIGERDGWVYHGRIEPNLRFAHESRRLVLAYEVSPTRCRLAAWERRIQGAAVDDSFDYQLGPDALDTVAQLLADRTSGTAPRTADTA